MAEKVDLIVLAAGQGTRARAEVPKQFLLLREIPVLVWALRPFGELTWVGRKIVTVPPSTIAQVEALLQEFGVTDFRVVAGGATRQESVHKALEHVESTRVMTHNAVQPFVTKKLIEGVAGKSDPCVTTVTPAIHAMCRGREFATQFVDRHELNLISTPQSFDTNVFRSCHLRALQEGIDVRTDCELMMQYGHRVRFVPGDPVNFKITTPLDVILAKALADQLGSN